MRSLSRRIVNFVNAEAKMAESNKLSRNIGLVLYKVMDRIFLPLDKKHLTRGDHLRNIPYLKHRRGGTYSYIEWGYKIDLLQPLIYQNLPAQRPIRALDIGSGCGRLAVAFAQYFEENDSYVGIDVIKSDVDFCARHYKKDVYSFIHFDVFNRSYAPHQDATAKPWPFDNESFNVATAISVWTHLPETDARFYISELSRTLRKGARALLSFFILDDIYFHSIGYRTDKLSQFYPQPQSKWIFDVQMKDSKDWFYPSWAKVPEQATGIKQGALFDMIKDNNLLIKDKYMGRWKETPGLFFQDIIVVEKL